jgi:uncharacterized protein with TBP-like fold DUF4468
MHIAKRPAGLAAAAFAILAGMEMAPCAHAQDFTAEFLRPAPMQKHELFRHTAAWMVESFSARPFIQVQSERLGTIVGRGTFDINIGGNFLLNRRVTYELRIDVRDSRYRMTFSDVEIPSDGQPRSIEYSDRGTDERQVHEHFEQLVDSLEKHLAAASEHEAARSLMLESCTPSLLLESCDPTSSSSPASAGYSR